MTENTNQTNHADRFTFTFEDTIAAMREVLSVAKRLQSANPTAKPDEIVIALRGSIRKKLGNLEAKYLKLTAKQRETLYNVTNAMEVMPEVAAILMKSAEADEDTIEAREAKLAEATAKRKAAADRSKATRETKTAGKKSAVDAGDMFADAE